MSTASLLAADCESVGAASLHEKSTYELPDAWVSDHGEGPSLLDYRRRIERIQGMPCNETCADCRAEKPEWASLLLDSDANPEGLGALLCQQCAVFHFQELGEKRAFIKYLRYFHEWTHPELDVLEHCGNDLVNEVYEATCIATQEARDADQQARFIKNKYRRCRYVDEQAFDDALDLIQLRKKLASNPPQPLGSRQELPKPDFKRNTSDLSMSSELTGSSCFSLGEDFNEEEFLGNNNACYDPEKSSASLPSLNTTPSFACDDNEAANSLDRKDCVRRKSRRVSRVPIWKLRDGHSEFDADLGESGQTERTEDEMTFASSTSKAVLERAQSLTCVLSSNPAADCNFAASQAA